MTIEVEELVEGYRSGVPLWSIESAQVTPDAVVVRFRDGLIRTTTREEVLAGMPAKFAAAITAPEAFATGAFDDEIGTVTWPNGADLAPEFLRWGPHKEQDCECAKSAHVAQPSS